MATKDMPGIPRQGLKKVGQIVATNDLRFHAGQNGLAIAVALLSTHTPGAPVVDDKGKFLGFISEFHVLRALEAGKDLNTLTAEDIMAKDRIVVHESTTIVEAAKMMEEKRLLNLPVEKNGVISHCVTRHDLLRAWIGLGLGMGLEP